MNTGRGGYRIKLTPSRGAETRAQGYLSSKAATGPFVKVRVIPTPLLKPEILDRNDKAAASLTTCCPEHYIQEL